MLVSATHDTGHPFTQDHHTSLYYTPNYIAATKTYTGFNSPAQRLQLVRFTEKGCLTKTIFGGSSVVYASSYTANATDLLAAKGAVAVIVGSSCPFSSWGGTYEFGDYYWGDIGQRAALVLGQGAAGVILGEGNLGKLPEQMANDRLTGPLCITTRATYDAVSAQLLAAPGQSLPVDTSGTYLYNSDDDALSTSGVTTVTAPGLWAPLPAVLATYDPSDRPALSGRVVTMALDPSCLAISGGAAATFVGCQACWALPGGPVTNAGAVAGAIALLTWSSATPACFEWYFHWEMLASNAGAAALLFSLGTDTFQYVPGLYLLPAPRRVLALGITQIEAEALAAATSSLPSLRASLPAVANLTAPAFATALPMPATSIGLWVIDATFQALNATDPSLSCPAGQAAYNPASAAALGPTAAAVAAGSLYVRGLAAGGAIVAAPLAAVCTSRSTCASCFSLAPASVFSRAAPAAAAASAASPGAPQVYLVSVTDLAACFSYTTAGVPDPPALASVAAAAAAAGAAAVVYIAADDVTAPSLLAIVAPQSPVPVFAVGNTCGNRLLAWANVTLPVTTAGTVDAGRRLLSGTAGGAAFVATPALLSGLATSPGVATAGSSVPTGTAALVQVPITAPVTGQACPGGVCYAAAAAFNPANSSALTGVVIPVGAVTACLPSGGRCAACLAAPPPRLARGDGTPVTAAIVSGAIVLLPALGGTCLPGVPTLAYLLQRLGAAAVVSTSDTSGLPTALASPASSPVLPLSIPTYTLAADVGAALYAAAVAHLANPASAAAVVVSLPGVVNSAALGAPPAPPTPPGVVPFGAVTPPPPTGAGSATGGAPGDLAPYNTWYQTTIIVVSLVGAFLLAVTATVLRWWLRHAFLQAAVDRARAASSMEFELAQQRAAAAAAGSPPTLGLEPDLVQSFPTCSYSEMAEVIATTATTPTPDAMAETVTAADPTATPPLATPPHRPPLDATECCVCLGAYEAACAVRRLPACGHFFHVACIDAWLSTHTTCPLCRADLAPPRPPTPSADDALWGPADAAAVAESGHESLLPSTLVGVGAVGVGAAAAEPAVGTPAHTRAFARAAFSSRALRPIEGPPPLRTFFALPGGRGAGDPLPRPRHLGRSATAMASSRAITPALPPLPPSMSPLLPPLGRLPLPSSQPSPPPPPPPPPAAATPAPPALFDAFSHASQWEADPPTLPPPLRRRPGQTGSDVDEAGSPTSPPPAVTPHTHRQ